MTIENELRNVEFALVELRISIQSLSRTFHEYRDKIQKEMDKNELP